MWRLVFLVILGTWHVTDEGLKIDANVYNNTGRVKVNVHRDEFKEYRIGKLIKINADRGRICEMLKALDQPVKKFCAQTRNGKLEISSTVADNDIVQSCPITLSLDQLAETHGEDNPQIRWSMHSDMVVNIYKAEIFSPVVDFTFSDEDFIRFTFSDCTNGVRGCMKLLIFNRTGPPMKACYAVSLLKLFKLICDCSVLHFYITDQQTLCASSAFNNYSYEIVCAPICGY